MEFERVYEQHLRDVYGYLSYRSGSAELAEDLTRQTFERARAAIGVSGPSPDEGKVWILTIARSTYIDFRAGSRSGAPPPGTGLTTAIAGLKRRERDAVALRFGGDLPVAQVAQVLAVPTDEAKRLLTRALRRLAGLIDPQPPA